MRDIVNVTFSYLYHFQITYNDTDDKFENEYLNLEPVLFLATKSQAYDSSLCKLSSNSQLPVKSKKLKLNKKHEILLLFLCPACPPYKSITRKFQFFENWFSPHVFFRYCIMIPIFALSQLSY